MKKRSVVIVGCAPRSFEHPEDAEVWVVNGPRLPPRWDRLFQLHGLDHLIHKHGWRFVEALAAIEPPRRLYMTRTYPEPSPYPGRDAEAELVEWRRREAAFTNVFVPAIPAAERFPIERLKAAAGDYFTNTFPMLIAFAVMEGFKEIILDGVMWSGGPAQWGAGEGWAVPCIEYHLGRAAALGVSCRVPKGCGLFAQRDFVYGFEGPGSV